MGGVMGLLFILRFFVFHLYESPKFLMGRGRDAEAVDVIHKVARYNGRESTLTIDMLKEVEREHGAETTGIEGKQTGAVMDTSARAAIMRKLNIFSEDHVKSLFATRKLAYSTSLLIILWGASMSCNILTL